MFDSRVRFLALRLLMISVLFLTPLLYFTPAHDQFELPKLVFLALSTTLMLALSLTFIKRSFMGPLGIALFLLLAAQIVSSLPGNSLSWQASLLGDYENFSGIATFLTYLSCFFAFLSAFQTHPGEKPFFFISLSALLSALYALAQHFNLDFVQWNPNTVNATREFASLGNPNFLSAFLAMALPLWLAWLSVKNVKIPNSPSANWWIAFVLGLSLLYISTFRGHLFLGSGFPSWMIELIKLVGLLLFSLGSARLLLSARSWFKIPGLAILALGLVSTGSRGGFFAAILAWCLYTVLTLQRSKSSNSDFKPKLPALFKIILLLVLLLPILWVGRSFLDRFYQSLTHIGESLATSRLEIWRPALKMVEAHPLWGVGLDTFKPAFPFYSGIGFNHIDGMFVSSRTAHNEMLQLAATTGLVGLGAYLLLWGLFFLLSFKVWRSSGPDSKNLAAGVMSCAVAYQLQNLFSFDVSAVGMVSFWLLAWIDNLSPQPILAENKILKFLRYGFPGLLLLLGLFFPLTRFVADQCFAQAEGVSEYLKKPGAEAKTQDLLEFSNLGIQWNLRAINICPLEVKYRLYLGLAYEQRAQLDLNQSNTWMEKALDSYRQAVLMSPANGYYYNDEGRVCANLGDRDPAYRPQAVEAYQQAVHWAPASPFFWVNLGLAQEENGKPDEASQSLKTAFSLDSPFTARCLAQAAVLDYQNGRKAGALDKLRVSMDGNTTIPEPYFYRGLIELEAHQRADALRDLLEAKKRTDPANPGEMSNLDVFIQQVYLPVPRHAKSQQP